MAQSSAVLTYDLGTVHEDLTDVLTNITPAETPFLSSFAEGPAAKDRYHEWLSDELAAPADNAQIEGAEFAFAKRETAERLGNYTQIFSTPVEVSETSRAVNTAGYEDEFAYQMSKAMKEHAIEIEIALATGTGNSGASGTARRMKGVLPFITDNVITGATGSGGEVKFQDALEAIWNDSGMQGEYTAYSPFKAARQLSSFTASATKYIENGENKVSQLVEIYETDAGVVRIKKHRRLPGGTIAVLGNQYHKLSWLRRTKTVDVAKTGDSTRKVILSELTYEAHADKANAKIVSMNS